jgi:medium-chain acyl-[acyl-carrier-protein] hydrolase
VRLFWFHHAGGSAASFRAFRDLLPPQVELRFVEHPGRGRAYSQPPIDDMPSLLAHLAADLAPALAGRFAFFGHSMGALVALALARHLADAGRAVPRWIGASGSPAPRHRGPGGAGVHLLEDAALCERLRTLGGTPAAVFACPELLAMSLRTLRTDYKLIETWSPAPAPPLAIPLAVYGGRDDRAVPPRALAAWRGEVTDPPTVRLFAGGHFYLMDRPREVAHAIAGDLASTDSPS